MAKTKAPEGETPQQKFVRVAGLRVSNLVQGLELLGQLGSDVPDPTMTEQAFGAIQGAVDKAKGAWTAKASVNRKRVFSFEDKQTEIPHTAPAKAQPQVNARK
jgi:hypothetical protein